MGTAAPINITVSVLEEDSIEEPTRPTNNDTKPEDTDNSIQEDESRLSQNSRNISASEKVSNLAPEKIDKRVHAEIHSSVVENSSKSVIEDTQKTTSNKENKSANDVDWEELWPSSNVTHGNPFVTARVAPEEEPWTTDPDFSSEGHQCYPILPLARIKHASDFTDTFLIQVRLALCSHLWFL